MLQKDLATMSIDAQMCGYLKQIIPDFFATYFGVFYQDNHREITQLLLDYEQVMTMSGVNDSELTMEL